MNKQAIGIFDSGVGGLTVLHAVCRLMPNEDLLYVADSLYNPYGDRIEQEIEKRVLLIAEFFSKQKVKAIVVACNTATAAAVNHLREKYKFPIVGLEPALKPAIEHSINKRVGVLATKSTLSSQKYLALKKKMNAHVDIYEKASPLFVKLVEDAEKLSKNELNLISKELNYFQDAQVDSLVLGCTHYPFLTDAINEILGSEVMLFESSNAVAKELQRRLFDNFNHPTHCGRHRYYSTNPTSAQLKFNRIMNHPVKLHQLTLI